MGGTPKMAKLEFRAYPKIRLGTGGVDLSWPLRPTCFEGSNTEAGILG